MPLPLRGYSLGLVDVSGQVLDNKMKTKIDKSK